MRNLSIRIDQAFPIQYWSLYTRAQRQKVALGLSPRHCKQQPLGDGEEHDGDSICDEVLFELDTVGQQNERSMEHDRQEDSYMLRSC